MRLWLFGALALLPALAGCGGGGGGSADPAPAIRFVGSYEPLARSMTLAPVSGAATLGTRPIAKVELIVDHGPVQVLAAPNAQNSAGQATFVFPVTTTAVGDPPSPFTHTCGPASDFEITVTDIGGFSFRKFISSCHTEVFGAFSDYGERTATFRAVGTAPMRATFFRYGAGGYYDSNSSSTGLARVTSSTWTLKAREADELRLGTDQDIAVGSNVTATIDGEGGAQAVSTAARTASTTIASTDSLLVCCTIGPAPAVTATRTVSFVVSPITYGVVLPQQPDGFDVYYRVFDPATNTVVAEFRGTGAGYSTWTFPVKAGYELRLEASPQVADTYAQMYISYGTGRGLDSPYSGNSLGSAQSNRTDAPAKLRLFCCTR